MSPASTNDTSSAATAAIALALFLAGRMFLQMFVASRRNRSRRRVGTVSAVLLYPVKSCLAVRVPSARVTEAGLVSPDGVLDRSFAVISTTSGKLLALKACPRLSLVQPVLDPASPTGIRLSLSDSANAAKLNVSDSVTVSIDAKASSSAGLEKFDMFGETAYGKVCDKATNAWLRSVCGRNDAVLVYCHQPLRTTLTELRECQRLGIASKSFDGCDMPSSGDSQIAYANTAPLLLATETALAALNRRLEEKGRPTVDHCNFRANLVIDGPIKDRDEESWSYVFFPSSGCSLAVLSPCTRCGITTVDYASPGDDRRQLRSDGEPLKTLAEYRKDGAFRKFSPVFGVNGFVELPGEVAVGGEVLVI